MHQQLTQFWCGQAVVIHSYFTRKCYPHLANLRHYSLPKWAFRKPVMTVEEASQIIWIQNNKSTLHALMESPAALWTRHQYEWHMSGIFSLTIGGCSYKLNLLQISSANVETQHWTSRTWSLRKPVQKLTYKLQTWGEDMDREHASENCLNSMLKALPAFLVTCSLLYFR